MPPHNRFQQLFEPLRIGPVTAPNRFYQVPHCTGMGYAMPQTHAAMRGMKAAGGWGVVCTEYCSIHPSSDDQSFPFAAIWDANDVRNHALMAEQVHAHGALAGVELWHGGSGVSNLLSRTPTLGVQSMPRTYDPIQSRRMDLRDIRQLRQWHRTAALRAREAGFDIVYVYPAHGYLLAEFMSRSLNDRSDAYGGSLENRMRLTMELIQDTRDAVGDRCAVAVRFPADGFGADHLSEQEAHDALALMAEMPDLWDLVVSDYHGLEMAGSRFVPEASLEAKVAVARKLTSKPVVSVGRFTSPDTMLRQITSGTLDLIGAARPSIADPFLPNKIRAGKFDDIRECIGCNICYAHNSRGAPIRCTQNPTMGEEWRRGWHPEQMPPGDGSSVLIVGAGPAGLQAAWVLGKRGFQVALAEAREQLGGRVTLESRLPGLSEWGRVRDYRLGQLRTMPNVALYPGNRLSAADVQEFDAQHILLATGAHWRNDGRGRSFAAPIATLDQSRVLTPDDVMAGKLPSGKVTIFDDDHYYMAPVLALLLASQGCQVRYVTSESKASHWSQYTGEQPATQAGLLAAGVHITVNHVPHSYGDRELQLRCIYSGKHSTHEADALLLVTSREPNDALYRALVGQDPDAKPHSIAMLGDCAQPALIAHAVYAGHLAGMELGNPDASAMPLPARDRLLV